MREVAFRLFANRRPVLPGGGFALRRSLAAGIVAALSIAACEERPPLEPERSAALPKTLIELESTHVFAAPGDTIAVWLDRQRIQAGAWVRWRIGDGTEQIPGDRVDIVALAAPDTIVVMVETGIGPLLSADTVRIVIADQFVVLKVDDLGLGPPGTLSPAWRTFLDFIEEADVSAAIGLVARSIETNGPAYVAEVRRLAASRHVEIWNHGYDHVLGAVDASGNVYGEFRGTSYDHQLAHLQRSQQLALDSLGVVMRAFGAPGNATDSVTTRALRAVPELEVWFFGRHGSDLLLLERRVEAESWPGAVSYERFRETYDATLPIITLQLHPASWDLASFNDFALIVEELQARGAAFVLPRDYAAYLSRRSSPPGVAERN